MDGYCQFELKWRFDAYWLMTAAITIENASPRKSAYETIELENHASGRRRRMAMAQSSPAGCINPRKSMRVMGTIAIVRKIRNAHFFTTQLHSTDLFQS
jgi:hypothetical protein